MDIYYQPHINHHGEGLFIDAVIHQFPDANQVLHNYGIPVCYLNKYIHTRSLMAALKKDQHFPIRKRQSCLEFLEQCPDHIKVTQYPHRISFDIVITSDDKTYYFEFHENQQRRLTVNRNSMIYNADNDEAIVVPRYFQRLVRDVWRAKYFRPFTIVWRDWFEAHRQTYPPSLGLDFCEFSLTHKFSFRDFLDIYNDSFNKR